MVFQFIKKIIHSIVVFGLVLICINQLDKPKPAYALTNLLTNPGAETGNFNGWTVVNGGSGWAINSDVNYAHEGTKSFVSSYVYGTLSQEINLSTAGYSNATMDAQPQINISTWVIGYGNGSSQVDPYQVTVILRDSSHNPIATFDTGVQNTSSSWYNVTNTFSSYGTGVRYIYFEQKGKDSNFWAGQYGSVFDDASLTIAGDTTPPTITNVTSSTANGSYTTGSNVNIQVNFSEAVTSTGNVTVTLETGTTDRSCTFSVSNATSGSCTYTVQAGDTSSDLTTNSIAGTIADQASNAMIDFTPATNLAANKNIIIDTTAPVISETTAVTTSTTDPTPDYSFTTNETGTITYGGSCTSATTSASVGLNTITFNTLAEGTYNNCTITVTDTATNTSNTLVVSTFTIDYSGPIISGLTSSTTNTLANISWTTNETSSTQVLYGQTDTYGQISSEQDTSPRVTSHTISLGGFLCGITYHYAVRSKDTLLNTTQSSDQTFNLRCPSSSVSTITPQSLTPTAQRGSSVNSNLGLIVNNREPITRSNHISIEMNGDPKSVKGYAISLDPAFAYESIIPYQPQGIFILPNIPGRYTIYIKYFSTTGHTSEIISQSVTLTSDTATSPNSLTPVGGSPSGTTTQITKILRSGDHHPMVTYLQKFLNNHGFIVATQGSGSPGNETTFFGSATKKALIKFQKTYNIEPATGNLGSITLKTIQNLN